MDTPYTNGKELKPLPLTLNMYGASDFATMAPRRGKRDPDFTEHGVFGVDFRGDLYATAWWSEQCETDRGIEGLLSLVRVWKPRRWAHEGGLLDKAIWPAIRRRMRETQTFVAMEALPSLMDKAVKLQAFHARACARTVWFPAGTPWAEQVIDQLVRFPAGRWDDKCDVCGLIGRMVDRMADARVPSTELKVGLKPFSAAWLETNSLDETPKVRYF